MTPEYAHNYPVKLALNMGISSINNRELGLFYWRFVG